LGSNELQSGDHTVGQPALALASRLPRLPPFGHRLGAGGVRWHHLARRDL